MIESPPIRRWTRQLEVRRQPRADPGARHGCRYASAIILGVADAIAPWPLPRRPSPSAT